MQSLLAPIRTLINTYLGAFAQDLDGSQFSLGLSLFSGNGKATLRDVILRPDAITALLSPQLPLRVHAGRIGRILVDIPVYDLLKKPVVVIVEDVSVLCGPDLGSSTLLSELISSQRLKASVLAALERHMMEAHAAALLAASGFAGELKAGGALGSPAAGAGNDVALFEGLLRTALANVQVRVSRIHVRYEHGLARTPAGALRSAIVGVTLGAATIDTVNERGVKEFVRTATSAAVDAVQHRVAAVEGLSIYADTIEQPHLFSGGGVASPESLAWMRRIFDAQAAAGEIGETSGDGVEPPSTPTASTSSTRSVLLGSRARIGAPSEGASSRALGGGIAGSALSGDGGAIAYILAPLRLSARLDTPLGCVYPSPLLSDGRCALSFWTLTSLSLAPLPQIPIVAAKDCDHRSRRDDRSASRGRAGCARPPHSLGPQDSFRGPASRVATVECAVAAESVRRRRDGQAADGEAGRCDGCGTRYCCFVRSSPSCCDVRVRPQSCARQRRVR